MRARGMRVGVMKPVDTVESQDAQALALAVGSILPMELICPYRFSSAVASVDADLAHIVHCFGKIAAQNDVVLVESEGTIDTPIAAGSDFADLAAMLALDVIVIVGNRPDCADAAMVAIQRCESRGLEVAGYILCDCDAIASATEVTERSLQRLLNVPYLGRMRHREPLARTIVEKLI